MKKFPPAIHAFSFACVPTGENETTPMSRPRFSEELRQLAGQFGERRASLGEILAATQGRGFNLLLVLISLPFITPIPLPGFSGPFGLVVVLVGMRLAMGKRPWLPRRL